jgi:hypothetical protein
MTDTPAVTPKRSHFGRYLLIFVLALIVLVVGFSVRGLIPETWLQKIPLFPDIPQVLEPNVLPTQPADTMAGMDHSSMGTTMPGLTATPRAPAIGAGGIVTVLTLTPTGAVTAAEAGPESTATAPAQESATPLPQAATPALTATVPPTQTLPPATGSSEVSADTIRTDLDDLYRILRTTTVLTETFQRGQPTEAELIALKAQLNVIDQRMQKLAAELHSLESPGDNQILLGQSSDLLELMRQAIGIVKAVLEGPTVNSVILGQTEDILEQLLAMVGQLQALVPSTQDTIQSTPVAPTSTASATPTLAPTATTTPVPSATVTPASVSSNQLDQMQTMLSQMIDQLGYMQSALEQKQGQPGTTPTP